MAKIQVRKASGWHTVADGTKMQVRKGGTWVTPTKIQVRKGGAWVTVWNKSDPVTLAFTCNASQGWRATAAWRTDTKVRFGAFQTFGDNLSVLEFSADSTTGGYTSTSLAEALAVRPNVTALKLTLTRGSGGASAISGSTSETLLVGQLNKANGTSMSTYNAGSFVQTTNMQTIPASDLQGWSYLSSQGRQFTFGGSALFAGGSGAGLLGGGGLIGTGGLYAAGAYGSAALGLMGAGLMLSGVSGMMTPQPKSQDFSSPEDPRLSFNFSGTQNTSRAGTPINIVFGEVFVGSIVVSAGVDTEQVRA